MTGQDRPTLGTWCPGWQLWLIPKLMGFGSQSHSVAFLWIGEIESFACADEVSPGIPWSSASGFQDTSGQESSGKFGSGPVSVFLALASRALLLLLMGCAMHLWRKKEPSFFSEVCLYQTPPPRVHLGCFSPGGSALLSQNLS